MKFQGETARDSIGVRETLKKGPGSTDRHTYLETSPDNYRYQ